MNKTTLIKIAEHLFLIGSITLGLFLLGVFVTQLAIAAETDVAAEEPPVVYTDAADPQRFIGQFPTKAEAQDLADAMNIGPLNGKGFVASVVENKEVGGYSVVVQFSSSSREETEDMFSNACTLTASSDVVRKGEEVTLTWQANYEELICSQGDENCGTFSDVSFEGTEVEGGSVVVTPTSSTVYTLSATVGNGTSELDGRMIEVTKKAACVKEVIVTGWFDWLLWRVFGIYPKE